jgi:hypothetical protein
MEVGTGERNTTRSHMDRSKDFPQVWGDRKEILGERITQTCMDEWIRLERSMGMIATTSGIMVVHGSRVAR